MNINSGTYCFLVFILVVSCIAQETTISNSSATTELSTAVTTLSTAVTDIPTAVTTLSTVVHNLKTVVTESPTTVMTLSSAVTDLPTTLTTLSTVVTNSSAVVTELSTAVTTLQTTVTTLLTTVAVNEKLVTAKSATTTLKTTPSTTKKTTTVRTTTIRTTTTPRPPVCSRHSFGNINDCCVEQIGALFKPEDRHKCYTSQENFNSANVIREYIANKWQNEKNNKLELSYNKTNTAHYNKILPQMKCFAECLFQNEDLLIPSEDNNPLNATLNATKISTFFTATVLTDNDKTRVLVDKAVNACVPIVTDLASSHQNHPCNILPFLFVQCIKREIFVSCTLPIVVTEIPRKAYRYAENCANNRKILKSCLLA